MEYQNLVQDNDNVSDTSVSPSDEDEPNSSSIPTTEANIPRFQSVDWNYMFYNQCTHISTFKTSD